MLELKGITKIYKTKNQEVRALNGVDLYFEETGMVFITGKSGSGKTTLLNVIGALDNFDDGEILIKGKSTKEFSKLDYDSYRNTFIGFIFQEYNLLDNMSIEKNLTLATQLQGLKDDKKQVEKILAKVDLKDVSLRKPQELSGGQRQRVAIARALIKNPSIIMADEPTGALDTENGLQIMSLLKKLSKDKLVIVVSHDLELANKFADRIIQFKDGKNESDITIQTSENTKTNLVEKKEILSIRRGATLIDDDLQKIKTAVKAGKDVHVTDNIDVIKQQTKIQKKKIYNENSNFIKTHLGFWDTIKLGLNTLKSKRIRLAITIILCALAFSIFGIFDSLAIYDEGRLAANTLKSSITPSVTMTTSITEDNKNNYDINFSNALIDSLKSQTGYDIKGVYNSYYIGTQVPNELKNNEPYKISKYYYYKNLLGAIEFNQDDLNNYNFSLLSGRLPNQFDEVAISEYFANCMLNWSYTYTDANNNIKVLNSLDEIINETNPLTLSLGTTGAKQKYKIVGIINTGTINKKFDKLKDNFDENSNMNQNEFKNYITNSLNLYAFVKPGFADYCVTRYNTLNKFINKAYNFEFNAKDGTVKTQRNTFYNFDDFEKLIVNNSTNNQEFVPYLFLENNKTKLNENEVLVDVTQFKVLYDDIITSLKTFANNNVDIYPKFSGYATEIDKALDDLKSASSKDKMHLFNSALSKLKEIQEVRNNEEDSFVREFIVTKTDTSKYQPGTTKPIEVNVENNQFKIVGFYTNVNVSATSSFILSTGGINNLGINLMQGPYSSFVATNTSKGNINSLSNLLLKSSGICYASKNNAIAMIRANGDFFANLSLLFLIVSGVFALFSIVMFSNFISTSIKNKYGEIGILRALGARGSDILKMFVVEAVAIALINAVCATILSAVGCVFVNMFLTKFLNLYIPLAAFGIRQVLIIFALSIGVGIISAIMPIASVSRQKPVETIRRAF